MLDDERVKTVVLGLGNVLLSDEGVGVHAANALAERGVLPAGTKVLAVGTALLDAIGRTIDDLGKRLAALPEEQRPGQVIVAIFTDGLENASQNYTGEKINKMIRHQREVYGWEFLFLAANQDAIATAARMGIDRSHSSRVQHSHKGMYSSHSSMSRKMRAMRHFSQTGEKQADYDAPMEEIVKEEEDKPENE